MKLLPLTQGLFAQVDDDVFEWASKVNWCASKSKRTFYAARWIALPNGKQSRQLLHREILKTRQGQQVDHIDGDGLNNTRSNLRVCSHAENARNRRRHLNNASGHVGVYFRRDVAKWRAHIRVNGIRKYLGYFDTAIEAARARDKAASKLHGVFARLNFPRNSL